MIDFALTTDFLARLCLTLLHSVWQVTLLAFIATVCGWLFCRKNVYRKYAINVAALIVALLAMPITFLQVESGLPTVSTLSPLAVQTPQNELTSLDSAHEPSDGMAPVEPTGLPLEFEIASRAEPEHAAAVPVPTTMVDPIADSTMQWWAPLAIWMSAIYLLGVAVMLVRLLVSIFKANQLAAKSKPISEGPAWEMLQGLCDRWSLNVVPRLMRAEQVIVPKVVGLIRPAILLPTSALTGLSGDQLEMILAHELAHIRRHDMWVYLIQRLAEAVLFFNPALWFLSRRVNDLREYCCDEMACEIVHGSTPNTDEPRLRYAQALLRVVELKQASSAVGIETTAALAAVGHSPSELRRRVARLFDEPLREPVQVSRSGIVALVVVALMLCVGPAVWDSRATPPVEDESVADVELKGDFVEQATDLLKSALLDNQYPYPNASETEAICTQFSKEINKAIESTPIDMDAVSAERRVAILTSMRDRLHLHLATNRLRAGSQLSFNRFYLGFPDRVKTLQWKLLMALQRGSLNADQFARHSAQRDWMRRTLRSLPEDRIRKHLRVIGQLDASFADPLETPFDQLMTEEQFAVFQNEVGALLKEARNKNENPLLYMPSKFAWLANRAIWPKNKCPESFDNDSVVGGGFNGSVQTLGFQSNRGFESSSISVRINEGMDVRTGSLTSGQQAGDIAFRANQKLVGLRGAKLLRVDVDNWHAADEVDSADLRRKIKALGSPSLSLKTDFQTEVEDSGELFIESGGIYVGVLTSDDELAVVNVEDFSGPDNVILRSRFRRPVLPATVSGKILLEDGSPAKSKGWLYYDLEYESGNSSLSAAHGQCTDEFSFETEPGTLLVTHFVEGYAPAWAGPVELKAGQSIDNIKLTLKPGFSELVRVSDEDGKPVPGATLVAHPQVNGLSVGGVVEHVTDAKGEFLLEHLADTRYKLTITAPGFQPLRTAPLRVEAGETLRPTMVRSQPNTGVVRFADGTPAPNSKILCKYEYLGDGHGIYGGREGRLLTQTDEKGRFELDQLSMGSRYLMVVEAVDGARAIMHDLQAGQNDVQIVLPTRLDLVVKVKGDVSKYFKPDEKPFVTVQQPTRSNFELNRVHADSISYNKIPIELTPDGGTAIVRGLAVDLDGPDKGKQKVRVTIGGDKDTLQIVDLNLVSATSVNFDLPGKKGEPEPKQEVPPDSAAAGNSAEALPTSSADAPAATSPNSLVVELKDKNGKPIPDAMVLVYDGNRVMAGKPGRFKQESGVADNQGVVTFDGILDRIPADTGYRVQVQPKKNAKWRARHIYVYKDKKLGADPLVDVARVDSGPTRVTFSLREECPLDVAIVGAKSDKRIHMAQLLFEDDRVEGWTAGALQDYVGDPGGDNPERLGLYFFTTFVPEMSDARFMATHEGYYPNEFKLNAKLTPDKKVEQRVELKPAPLIELTVRDSDGAPAIGAKLKYLGPDVRGSMSPVKPADQAGRITLKYPELGQLARYLVTHQGQSAEFTTTDLPALTWQRSKKPSTAILTNNKGWALIRHTVMLADPDRQTATEKPKSLIVELRDKDGQPISGVKMRLYDGQHVWRGQDQAYKMEFAVSDAAGNANFPGLLDRIGKKSGYWIEIFRPKDAKWHAPARIIGRGTKLSQVYAENPLIKTQQGTDNFTITVALREQCPTDIEIVDSLTGKRKHRAQLLFKDDRVQGWTVAALQDYVFDDTDNPDRLVLDYFTTIVEEMSDAKFMATHEGYYPVEFQLPEKLSPEKTVRKRVELKPAPLIELTVLDTEGKPAVGAKLEYLGPNVRGGGWPVKPADQAGRITTKYPELGKFARYRVTHGSQSAEFTAADYPQPVWQASEKPNTATLTNEQGWALIRHTINLKMSQPDKTNDRQNQPEAKQNVWSSGSAAESQRQRPSPVTAQQKPSDKNRQRIATVLGKPIYQDQIELSASTIEALKKHNVSSSEQITGKLVDNIWWPVRRAYIERENLRPAKAGFSKEIEDLLSQHPEVAERFAQLFKEDKELQQEYAMSMLWKNASSVDWLLAKSLYEKHGGHLAMSSFGAYLSIEGREAVLRDYARRGKIKFEDASIETRFWKRVQQKYALDATVSDPQRIAEIFKDSPLKQTIAVERKLREIFQRFVKAEGKVPASEATPESAANTPSNTTNHGADANDSK